MNVGYVGLGSMGGALARRLQLTYPLQVYDLDAGAVARMVQAGATACGSLRDLAAHCDVILLFNEMGAGAQVPTAAIMFDRIAGTQVVPAAAKGSST